MQIKIMIEQAIKNKQTHKQMVMLRWLLFCPLNSIVHFWLYHTYITLCTVQKGQSLRAERVGQEEVGEVNCRCSACGGC